MNEKDKCARNLQTSAGIPAEEIVAIGALRDPPPRSLALFRILGIQQPKVVFLCRRRVDETNNKTSLHEQ